MMITMTDLLDGSSSSSSLLLDFVTCIVLYVAYQVPHNLHHPWTRRLLRWSCYSFQSNSRGKIPGKNDEYDSVPLRKDSYESSSSAESSSFGTRDDDDESVGRSSPLHSTLSSSSFDKDESSETWLLQEIPDSTLAERRRFLLAASRCHSTNNNNSQVQTAAKNLRAYLDWRRHHFQVEQEIIHARGGLTVVEPSGDDDLDVWNKACAIAMHEATTIAAVAAAATAPLEEEGQVAKASSTQTQQVRLPRVIRTHYTSATTAADGSSSSTTEVCDANGQRIIHIMPGQMDSALASFSTYALAIALYFEFKLHDRESQECITLVVDARGGRGWPNPHATKLLPFMQQVVTLLLTLFPERLGRSIVFPLPFCFCWIWNLVQTTCISDTATRQKICLLTGPARIASPPPFPEMYPLYMCEATARLLEKQRVAAFKDDLS